MRFVTRTHNWVVIAIGAIVCAAAASPAFAQSEPRLSVTGAYVFLQQQTAGQLDPPKYPFGWLATAAGRLGGGRWSAVGEFGISYKSNDVNEQQLLTGVLGGARVALSRSKRVTVFAQGLAGLERFSEPGLVESGIAIQPGGGLDIHVSSRVFIRAQGDYRWSQANDATFHAYRIVAGVGYALR